MATHASSTRTPVVKPPLLRGNVTTIGPHEGKTITVTPCEGIPVMRMPFEVFATVSFLETTPLPSLMAAFSRRRQIFGCHNG